MTRQRQPGSWVSQLGRKRTYAQGELLLQPGDAPACCWYIHSGRVVTAAAGEEPQILLLYEAGRLLLAQQALTGRTCDVLCRAATPVTAQQIPRAELLRAVQGGGQPALDVIEAAAAETEALTRRCTAQRSTDAACRVAGLLLDLADCYGTDSSGMLQLTERTTQQSLAELAGMHRVTVTRALQQLRQAGLLRCKGGYFYLLNRPALQALCQS